jgi:aryl-alcohol dehydrogenase-like predicted oxidoreductase
VTSTTTAVPAPRRLGSAGPLVTPLALGCMGMSGMYGAADEAESIATIQAALDAGVTLLDTGDFYGSGHNEMLIARAIAGRRERVLLSVKFGALRTPDGGWGGYDARPMAIRNFAAYSLKRLQVEHIDVYRPARLDPQVPIEDVIGAMADLVKAGYVRYIGLSEVGAATIRRAHAVHPICDLQIEYSLLSRGPESGIFPLLQQLGIGITAYGVLSRGLIGGSRPGHAGDLRAHLPRFSADNLERNRALLLPLEQLAAEQGLAVSQLAIAWVLSRSPSMIAVIGARTRSQLAQSLAATRLALSAADLQRIAAAVPTAAVAGERYGEQQMRMLDSERGDNA